MWDYVSCSLYSCTIIQKGRLSLSEIYVFVSSMDHHFVLICIKKSASVARKKSNCNKRKGFDYKNDDTIQRLKIGFFINKTGFWNAGYTFLRHIY
jgi:hypothetical protein